MESFTARLLYQFLKGCGCPFCVFGGMDNLLRAIASGYNCGFPYIIKEAKNAINEKCMASLRLPEIKEIQGYMKKPVKYCPVHTKMLAMCSYRRV